MSIVNGYVDIIIWVKILFFSPNVIKQKQKQIGKNTLKIVICVYHLLILIVNEQYNVKRDNLHWT